MQGGEPERWGSWAGAQPLTPYLVMLISKGIKVQLLCSFAKATGYPKRKQNPFTSSTVWGQGLGLIGAKVPLLSWLFPSRPSQEGGGKGEEFVTLWFQVPMGPPGSI